MTISDRQVLDDTQDSGGGGNYFVRRKRPEPFSLILIVACVAATLYEYVKPEFANASVLYGPAIAGGQSYRLLTGLFVHGGVLHIAMNGLAIWNLGNSLERAIGTGKLALASVVCALGSNTLVMLFAFYLPTLGISGVICGWLGVMFPIATAQGRRWLVSTIIQIAVISALPGVSWQGHLGGFLFGLPVGFAMRNGGKWFNVVAPVLIVLAFVACVFSVKLGGAYSHPPPGLTP